MAEETEDQGPTFEDLAIHHADGGSGSNKESGKIYAILVLADAVSELAEAVRLVVEGEEEAVDDDDEG